MSSLVSALLARWKYTDGSAHQFASAKTAGVVTPNDTTVLDFNAIYIGSISMGTEISIKLENTSVIFKGLNAGTILPVQGIGVNLTGTSASELIWLKW